MTITVEDVRKLLDKLASGSVSSNTIQANIADASTLVNKFVKTYAEPDLVDTAIKRVAVWLSYVSYAEGQSFQLGATPMVSKDKIDGFREMAELYLNLVSDERVDLEDIRRTDMQQKEAGLPNITFTGTVAFED